MNLQLKLQNCFIFKYIKAHPKRSVSVIVLLIAYYFCLPKTLFKAPTATVITSHSNQLLGAQIATDGQWRFPESDSTPEKFKQCILYFEDEYFYNHPGFNPISIYKAFKQNLKSNTIQRGASTITQQVIRLSRHNKPRTYFEKLKEFILATRLELRYSKDAILKLYANHAPFGGNVVGLDAASWRYFNRSSHNLSWAESATLAVLPNAPSLIFPGKNQQQLLQKRNKLLQKLLNHKVIDSLTYELSLAEILPEKPYALPKIAPHLLQKVAITQKGKRVKTTINKNIQQQTNTIVANHYNTLKQNEIYNIAVLVLDVETREVLTYVGNSPTDKLHQKDVDVIDKPRSTGSILKPFLYAAMLDSGDILPNTLVADVPTQFGNYNPENYNNTYVGAIPASKALSQSLNVPSVRLLQTFGLDRFYHYLKKLQLKDLTYNANHYGLSLILGGAESNLWDLCKSYAAMASTLNHFNQTSSEYFSNEFCEPTFIASESVNFGNKIPQKSVFDAASIYATFQSLKDVNRPEGDVNWINFNSTQQIAWKTGTSFGFRDAWAIGVTSKYVVGVWVGNADGEGRPGLVGVQAAAPILFDVFDVLPKSTWFNIPYDAMYDAKICSKSGYRASLNCTEVKIEYIPVSGLKTQPCLYHKLVHLDKNEYYQVDSSCEPIDNMVHKSWFVLPPLMAHYYKENHPFYKPLPPYRSDCLSNTKPTMQFIYPKDFNTIFLPKDFDGKTNELILKLAHSKPETQVYWYVDERYIATTQTLHEIAISPTEGEHIITVVDAFGNTIKRKLKISG